MRVFNIKFREKAHVCVITLGFILSACATESINIPKKPSGLILPPAGSSKAPAETASIVSALTERNKAVEDSPEWIKGSYKVLRIRNLKNIPTRDDEAYAKYLDNGSVYIVVHPAFFPFFHAFDRLPSDGRSKENVVDKFLEQTAPSAKIALLQAQERRMRDFLEYKSTEKKLIVVIPLKDYRNYSSYIYKDGPDEYTRYLNELTNDSESVVYIESGSPTRGYLKEEDVVRLTEFLAGIGAKRVLIGGSYVGRCLEDFYVHFIKYYGREGVYLVPELSDVSPRELSSAVARNLLLPDGSINIEVATDNLKKDVYQVQERQPDVINLP